MREKLLVILVVALIGFFVLVNAVEGQADFNHPGYPGAYEQESGWGERWDNNTFDECLFRDGRWYRWSPPTLLHLWWDEGHIYQSRDHTVFKSHNCLNNQSTHGVVHHVGGLPAFNLYDGRLNNNQSLDVAAPVALYVRDGVLDVYLIDQSTGAGNILISVVLSDNVGQLAQSGSVSVWRLSTGEYQVNAFYPDGKPYVIVWGQDGAYHPNS